MYPLGFVLLVLGLQEVRDVWRPGHDLEREPLVGLRQAYRGKHLGVTV